MKRIIFICFAFAILSLFGVSESLAKDDGTGGAGYADADSCADCHDEVVEAFASSTHGNKKHPRTPASSEMGCQSCHGPMAEHVENEGPEEGQETAKVKPAACMSCHNKGKVALWSGSAHEMRGVSCSDCHDAHSGHDKELTAAKQEKVCADCHKKVRSELLRTSHHPIREGKMTCSDCHNTHGTVADKLLAADSLNQKCYECHAEKRGPFLWEHAPVIESCSTCHKPHGSVHDKLLTARTPYMCTRCHSNSRHPGTLYAQSVEQRVAGESIYTSLNNRGFYRNCMNCHNQIHGSNHPSGKSLGR